MIVWKKAKWLQELEVIRWGLLLTAKGTQSVEKGSWHLSGGAERGGGSEVSENGRGVCGGGNRSVNVDVANVSRD